MLPTPVRNPVLPPILDILVALLLAILSYFIGVLPLARQTNIPDSVRKWVIPAWLARVGGAFFTYYFYLFYYNGGDLINYVNDSLNFYRSFFYMPMETLYFITSSLVSESYSEYISKNPFYYWFIVNNFISFSYIIDKASETVAALLLPFAIISFGSANGVIVAFATYSFRVSFQFLLALRTAYPQSWHKGIVPTLFLPSILSWIALPFKEGFALTFVMYAMRILFLTKSMIYQKIISIILLFFAYIVKPYIVISLIPILGFTLIYSMSRRLRKTIFHYILFLTLCALITLSTFLLLTIAAEKSEKYSLDRIAAQAHTVYTDLAYNTRYYELTGGSAYDIGDFEPTVGGMLSKFPIAFFTGLFRPFVWEAQKGVILVASLEGTFLLIFMFYGIFRYGLARIIKQIASNVWGVSWMTFAIFFLFMVGLTSGNFGNLVRYRVPGFFFFFLVIFLTYGELVQKISDRRSR